MKEFNTDMIHCDALGNPIVIGSKYGWATNSNGITNVTIGIAQKLSKTGVVIEVLSLKRALYTNKPEKETINSNAKTTNVRGMILFPVEEDTCIIHKNYINCEIWDTSDHGCRYCDNYRPASVKQY